MTPYTQLETTLRKQYHSPFEHELQIRLCRKIDDKWSELNYELNSHFEQDFVKTARTQKFIAVVYYGRMLYVLCSDDAGVASNGHQQLSDYAQQSISKQLRQNNL